MDARRFLLKTELHSCMVYSSQSSALMKAALQLPQTSIGLTDLWCDILRTTKERGKHGSAQCKEHGSVLWRGRSLLIGYYLLFSLL